MRHATIVAAALAAGLSAVALGAQQNPRTLGPGSGPTTIVDFFAVDAKGQPVTDLTPADVAIRVDGKARDIKELQLVKRERPLPLGAAAPDPMPLPFASNARAGDTSRVILIVFDNETISAGREQRVRDGIAALINMIGPRDVASIITVPHGGPAIDLTSDHDKLRATAAKLLGAAPNTATETNDERACRSRLTVQALATILSQREGADTPTEVIFVSSALSGPRSNVSSGSTQLGRGSVGGCQLPNDDFMQLGKAATSARAHFFIVQPEQIGTSTMTGADSPLAGLENIASLTGAPILHLAGADEPHFQRVVIESSAYYSATLVLDPSDRGDGIRQLSVKTTRPDVTIHARPSIALAGNAPKPGAAPSPKDMLRTATEYRDTPLRLTAFASRNSGDGKVKIVAMAESMAGAKFSAAAIGLYDSTNKLVAQWSADGAALGAPALITAFVQNPGVYRVRVGVTDTGGRGGTADYSVNATLTPAAGVLTLSALVLGSADGTFTPKFQFTNEPQAMAYFELYGGKQGMPVSVAVELASTLNGPAMTQLQPKIAASSEADKYIITVPIPIGALPPGDYVVRAIVGLDGQPAGRIVRTLRKAQ